MKVLHVATVAATINAFLLPFAREFRDLGWQVDAAAEGIKQFPDVQNAHDKCYEIGFCRNPLKIRALIQSMIEIRNLLKRERYDIVHVHTPIASFLTRIASIGLGSSKLFYTAHGFHYVKSNPFWKNAVYYLAEKCAGQLTDHLFVINQDDYSFAVKRRILSKDKITFLPGIGVDPNEYYCSNSRRKLVREQIGVSDKVFLILQVAELNENKNHHIVIRALELFKESHPTSDFIYLVVGAGEKRLELENLAKAVGLSHQIMFLGQRDDVPDLLSACDVVTLSSLREGLPRCLLEAMSVGRPIIASNIRGCKDLLSSGAGVLVDPKNSQQWAKAIQNVYLSPNQAKAMADKGRELIINRYQEKKVVPLVVDVYLKEITND